MKTAIEQIASLLLAKYPSGGHMFTRAEIIEEALRLSAEEKAEGLTAPSRTEELVKRLREWSSHYACMSNISWPKFEEILADFEKEGR
jgi:hypothetical protein